MEKYALNDDLSCENIDDVLVLDDDNCVSISATQNILGKFWGQHHETAYFLIRD